MRRGPKPAKSKEGNPPVTRKSPKNEDSRVGDLEKRLAEALKLQTEAQEQLQKRDRELAEALEQQTATSEILRVISSSPADVQPVFDAIAREARRLCGASIGVVGRYDGELLHLAAHELVRPEGVEAMKRAFPIRPSRAITSSRAVLERAVVHVVDVHEDPDYDKSVAHGLQNRSTLAVPMLRNGEPIGSIAVARLEAQPFTDEQIALLQTFANQAVIAIDNARLFTETKEALEQQTATAEILRIISSSPTNVQPTFEAIAESATRLCGAVNGLVFRFDGELIHVAATHNIGDVELDAILSVFPIRPGRGSVSGRAIESRRIVHVEDLAQDPGYEQARVVQAGFRTALSVPMLHGGVPIGAINVMRMAVAPFSPSQISLLQTFADQAVIAIENVRLFNETKEALDRQTATSDILRVISSSPTDIQPVFGAIADSAMRLLAAWSTSVWRYEDGLIRLVAARGGLPGSSETFMAQRRSPTLPAHDSPASQTVLTQMVFHSTDVDADPSWGLPFRAEARMRGFRSIVAVPILRGTDAVGVIAVTRAEVGGFTPAEIALLKTFADQAVIAIENVRLFTELQASNRDLTTALDKQTATSDILRVISQSQTDIQPVFDAIVTSATRLLRGHSGAVTRIAGTQIELAALTSTDNSGDATVRSVFPIPIQIVNPYSQAVRDRAAVNIADVDTDPGLREPARTAARARGFRSWVVVPMLHHAEVVGMISVTRREPGGFTAEEIALLQTFADQAVIAIENARLLNELQARTQDLSRSVDQLTALGEVGRAVSSTLDLQTVLTTIVGRAVELSGTSGGVIYEHDEATGEFRLRANHQLEVELVERLREAPFRVGEGVTGRAAAHRTPTQVKDILTEREVALARISPIAERLGYRSILAIPLLLEDRIMGGLTVWRKQPGDFAPDVVDLLQTFAAQSSLAIQNARLFREIEDKSRQLEVASQHKSEFLANMSHELRTPLNAIIGFSEVLTDRMFGELNEKQEEYLRDIYASGTHLLSLINDILDLSKIEAGRMELELTDFDLPTAIESALTLVRERAGRRSIALRSNIDNQLGQIRADERKVRQVVLNLLSNAIKFTPEGGRIDVGAVPKDGFVEVSVTDTGIGIASEDQERVFEEFRQVGTAAKKIEGTGLGLTLCRKFVELHAGKIWVKSQVGVGSTFTFTIPVRRGE
jgi:GAF domain-containing protein